MLKIEPFSLKTSNINEALEEFATQHSIKIDLCEFKISSVETFVRDTSNTEFTLFNHNIKEEYKDKENLINEHVEFSQHYNIIIYEMKKCKIKLKYTLDFGEYSSHPKIIISPDSHIPHSLYQPKELLSLLFRELNKIKAKYSIIIGLYDESMIKNLKVLVKYIYAKKFVKKVKIPLFDGVEADLTQESKLVMKFLDKENSSQIIEVEKDEVLIDFYKPQFGTNGLDCFGKEIGIEFANNKDDLKQEIDTTTIKIIEKAHKRSYLSKIKGFVQYSDTRISIDHKIKMNRLSRVQTSLASEESNNIEVTISQYDTNKDSIGEGVELISETVHVSGHIGANSRIEATNLKIDGATHQDSKQFAKFAEINRHKGKLRCHSAKIKLLEGGEVHATLVDVETCLSGTIYAQDVIISHVKNNLKVFASNSITIKLVSGEDNKFIIDYKKVPVIMSKINFIKNDIEDLEFSLEEAQRHTISLVDTIKTDIKKKKELIQNIKNSTQTAKITIESPLKGLNNIIFTIDDENELTYKTLPQQYTPFYLEYTDNKIILHPTNKTISLND